jgi:iron complex transport system substrate-binding protein
VFFEISREPLMSVNRDHAISEIIRLCGGENSFADIAQLVFVAPLEELLRKQPDAIIYTASEKREEAPWPRYRGTKAWDNKRIYRIAADPILRRYVRRLIKPVNQSLRETEIPALKIVLNDIPGGVSTGNFRIAQRAPT